MSKAFVLHSGGMDSTTCLAIAKSQFDEVVSISADYGQRHIKEIKLAEEICGVWDIEHRFFKVTSIPKTMLTNRAMELPNASYDDLPDGISPTYVPFRNGLLLSNIAAIAQAEEADAIFFGAHAGDAENWAYPDCTPEFIGSMANAIYIGTYQKVRLHTPLQWMIKSDIVKAGDAHDVPWELTWSCYKGDEIHCGTCPTCRDRKQAFIVAGIPDPTEYEVNEI